jgi:hypothetical protein
MYKLLRFLVGRLSECCETGSSSATYNAILEEKDKTKSFPRDSIANLENGESHKGDIEDSSNNGHLVNHNSDIANIVSRQMHSSKAKINIDQLQSGENLLQEEATTKLSDMQILKEQHPLSESAADMLFDVQHPSTFHKQLNDQTDAKRHDSIDLESHGDALKKALEGKRRNLEDSLFSTKPEIHAKLQKLKQIELEMQSLMSETKKREDEAYNLSVDVEKQPMLAPRKSFIQRISEITKNSRKQDSDVERILKDTRELQLESNSIQERLHRTYAIVDETVIREGKKDPVGQQAYRLLVSIHEGFAEMSEKILATDRTQREAAEFEAKLCAIASRSLDLGKLQADLDAIKKENESLYHHLAHKP